MIDVILKLVAAVGAIFLTTWITNKLVGDYQREWLEKKYGKKMPKHVSNFGIPFTKVGFVVFILVLSISLWIFEWIVEILYGTLV